MALRLTGTALPSATSPSPVPLTAVALAASARAALQRDDVTAFGNLFDEAARVEDLHRRFEAVLSLIQSGFEASGRRSDAVSLRIFVETARRALDILEANPAEPTLLNLAGVALYELWGLDGAHALFSAARRLDPGLGDVEDNLAHVATRRRAGRRTRPLHAAVPGLTRRAVSVARRARPASGLTLSLCMIVRDEEKMLPRCLAAVAPAVDEIIVVDTGSVDSTVEIARSFGARVIEFPWTGSFAEARNVSFEAATGDWLLYLDADEVLVKEDVERLRALTGRTWREAMYLIETSYIGELGEGTASVSNALRVFRNRPEYRFTNQLHEQIYKTLPEYLPMRFEQTTVRIEHYGYLGSVRSAKDKSRRNIELLLQEAATAGESPFRHFNLGSEYAVCGDLDGAARELRRSREMLVEQGLLGSTTYAPPLLARLIDVLRLSSRFDEAQEVAAETLELLPDFTDVVVDLARIAHATGDADEARRLFERCLEMGDAPSAYGGMVGAGTFWPRFELAALARQQGALDESRRHLAWSVEHHPEFLAAAAPYATVLLESGADAAGVREALASLGELPARIRIAIGEAFRLAGHRAAAIEEYRLALEAAPSNEALRAQLAELLLATGAFEAAAEVARGITPGGSFGALAARIILIASIGRVDPAEAQATLAQARAAGLPAGEQAVFEHWIGLTGASAPTTPVPAAGAPLLTVILQTLLAAGDGERFVALLPALHGCEADEREKRQWLGEMYLAHGLLDRAAEQWMAVCAAAPDARALLGLARVAARSAMPQDAITFATGALELDPRISGASELLAGLGATAPAVAA